MQGYEALQPLCCPRCTAAVPADARACGRCGQELRLSADRSHWIAVGSVCPRCNRDTRAGQAFVSLTAADRPDLCPHCGSPMEYLPVAEAATAFDEKAERCLAFELDRVARAEAVDGWALWDTTIDPAQPDRILAHFRRPARQSPPRAGARPARAGGAEATVAPGPADAPAPRPAPSPRPQPPLSASQAPRPQPPLPAGPVTRPQPSPEPGPAGRAAPGEVWTWEHPFRGLLPLALASAAAGAVLTLGLGRRRRQGWPLMLLRWGLAALAFVLVFALVLGLRLAFEILRALPRALRGPGRPGQGGRRPPRRQPIRTRWGPVGPGQA